MIRGTTTNIDIELPQVFDIATCYVTFTQRRKIMLDKTIGQGVEIDGNVIRVALSQEDTLALKEGDLEVQVRFRVTDGRAYATEIDDSIEVERALKGGVI